MLASPNDPKVKVPSILILQKTPFEGDGSANLVKGLQKVEVIEGNDIYHWMLGWLGAGDSQRIPDVKINLISPATQDHIRKYSSQKHSMVRETPELYVKVTKPYIEAFPLSRTQWVRNILSHVTEADQILFEDPSPTTGYILLPDMKWDRKSLGNLYLVAIAHSPDIKTLRDLRREHIEMLRSIYRETVKVAKANWGIESGGLRFYIHYQPSYYQFHVHIVTVEYTGFSGMSVGQAHLLEDLISLLEVDATDGLSIFERMTLTYVLGEQHGLYELMRSAGGIGTD